MEAIDIVYYINLDHRVDRNEEFLEWIVESGFPVERVQRIPGIYTPGKGHHGCLLSHIKTLELFLESSFSNCIIFEDDYVPFRVEGFWKHFDALYRTKKEFDIILCSYNTLKSEEIDVPFLRRVQESTTTSSYLITRAFAPVLLELWKQTFVLVEEEEKGTGKKTQFHTADVSWQTLMPKYTWLTFYPRIGRQRPSFSDIEMINTNYRA